METIKAYSVMALVVVLWGWCLWGAAASTASNGEGVGCKVGVASLKCE